MAEIMARRFTADNKEIIVWTDGDLTNGTRAIGRLVTPGYINVQVARLMLDDICLYDYSEMVALRACARQAIAEETDPAMRLIRMRGLMSRKTKRKSRTGIAAR